MRTFGIVQPEQFNWKAYKLRKSELSLLPFKTKA